MSSSGKQTLFCLPEEDILLSKPFVVSLSFRSSSSIGECVYLSSISLHAFFFSFAGDYSGRPVVVMNEAVLRRSPMVPYSLLCIVVASGQKSLLSRWWLHAFIITLNVVQHTLWRLVQLSASPAKRRTATSVTTVSGVTTRTTSWTSSWPARCVRQRLSRPESGPPVRATAPSVRSLYYYYFFYIFFLTLSCLNGNFSHGKFGSLSPRKASCNRVTLPNPN